ncbi:GNAT family N-acetyltransferase [Chungangia koreensis]|uniref:GNAT family N-acetyltransferase n=1 Tax=Chungangia koreensis TaxID=752657 RepID=A0ABV8X4H6_9LACT
MPHTELNIDCGEILLRPFQIEDAYAISRISSEPEISAFLPDWKAPEEKRRYWLTEYEVPMNQAFLEAVPTIDEHMLKLAILHKETNRVIGWCCSGIKDELPEPNREIVYAVSSEFQNRGFATKAVQGLIDYLFSSTDTKVLNAIALTNNEPSTRVIQKCGFRYNATIEIDHQLYKHFILQK